jgi:hypothetical protein
VPFGAFILKLQANPSHMAYVLFIWLNQLNCDRWNKACDKLLEFKRNIDLSLKNTQTLNHKIRIRTKCLGIKNLSA